MRRRMSRATPQAAVRRAQAWYLRGRPALVAPFSLSERSQHSSAHAPTTCSTLDDPLALGPSALRRLPGGGGPPGSMQDPWIRWPGGRQAGGRPAEERGTAAALLAHPAPPAFGADLQSTAMLSSKGAERAWPQQQCPPPRQSRSSRRSDLRRAYCLPLQTKEQRKAEFKVWMRDFNKAYKSVEEVGVGGAGGASCGTE